MIPIKRNQFHLYYNFYCSKQGGYKGYGLGMLVEILCGIIADAAFGPNVRRWLSTDKPANLVSSQRNKISKLHCMFFCC